MEWENLCGSDAAVFTYIRGYVYEAMLTPSVMTDHLLQLHHGHDHIHSAGASMTPSTSNSAERLGIIVGFTPGMKGKLETLS